MIFKAFFRLWPGVGPLYRAYIDNVLLCNAQIHKELSLSILFRYVLRIVAISLFLNGQTFYCQTKLFYKL